MTTAGWIKQGEHIGVRELRESLSKVLKSQKVYFVTDHGKPVRADMPYETFLEMLEMLEELKDKTLVQEIAQGRREYHEGGWVPVGRLKKSLEKS